MSGFFAGLSLLVICWLLARPVGAIGARRRWAAPPVAGAMVLALLLPASPAAALASVGGEPAAGPGAEAPPRPARTWQEVNHAAKVAHDAKDFAAYRSEVGLLGELLSGNPATVFATAQAEALLGHAAAALEWLEVYAGMGLVRDVAADAELASLRGQAGFAAVQARIEANRRPIAHAAVVLSLADPGLLSEDLAYDPAARRFFVSSIREAKIVAVDAKSGAARDFVPAGRDAIWGVLALAVDARHGALWATTAAMPQTVGQRAADLGHTAVLRYDLATGKLVRRYDLPAAGTPGGGPVVKPGADPSRVLGDMTVTPGGEVFVSESVTGAVYTIRPGGDRLEELVPAGTFVSPQNPAATPDGRRLLVADYVRGIGVIDLQTRAVSWMAHPPDAAVNGIDGMYLDGASLIAVQNGTEPNRIVRFDLDPGLTRIVRWQALESNSPGLGAPTHGTVVGRDFFFLANSGWDQLADDGTVKPGAHLTAPQVRRLAL